MKKNGKLMAALGAVVVLAGVMAGVYMGSRPDTQAGEKTVSVEVVHKDESTREFTYQTDMEYLGELLLAEGLIVGEEGPYGLYITEVDGEQAIYEVDQSYWAFYQDGDYATQGVDLTPIADGDQFAFVYTIG